MNQNLLSTVSSIAFLKGNRKNHIPPEYQPAILLPPRALEHVTTCSATECKNVIVVKDSVCVLVPSEDEGPKDLDAKVCCSLECLLEFMPAKGNV